MRWQYAAYYMPIHNCYMLQPVLSFHKALVNLLPMKTLPRSAGRLFTLHCFFSIYLQDKQHFATRHLHFMHTHC